MEYRLHEAWKAASNAWQTTSGKKNIEKNSNILNGGIRRFGTIQKMLDRSLLLDDFVSGEPGSLCNVGAGIKSCLDGLMWVSDGIFTIIIFVCFFFCEWNVLHWSVVIFSEFLQKKTRIICGWLLIDSTGSNRNSAFGQTYERLLYLRGFPLNIGMRGDIISFIQRCDVCERCHHTLSLFVLCITMFFYWGFFSHQDLSKKNNNTVNKN